MSDYAELRRKASALLDEAFNASGTWRLSPHAEKSFLAARRAYVKAAEASKADAADCYLLAGNLWLYDSPRKALRCVAKAVASGDLPGELYVRARRLWNECQILLRNPARETFDEFVRRAAETPCKPSREPAPGQAVLFADEEDEA